MANVFKAVSRRTAETMARGPEIGRRQVTIAFGVSLLAAAPGFARAQAPGGRKRIGLLSPGISTSPNTIAVIQEFLMGMADRGWVEGRDFEIIARLGENQNDRLPALARELVALAPDVIVATVNPAQIYLREATTTIPIVFAYGTDPIPLGLAASHNRPGGNVTGVIGSLADGFMPKRLQFARELVPDATRIGMPFNVSNPQHVLPRKAAEEAATILKLTLIPVEVRVPDDLDEAFAKLKAGRVEIVLPVGDNLFFSQSKRMGALAAVAGLPLINSTREDVHDGAILGYGVNVLANFRRAGYFVDRILKGTKPGDLPIEFPTTFDLVVNLKVAKTLGITVPPAILLQATEVIE